MISVMANSVLIWDESGLKQILASWSAAKMGPSLCDR